jgi:hypothetical protein
MIHRLFRFAAIAALPFALGAAEPAFEAKSSEGLPVWLAGSWQMENGANWAEELWTDPRDGMMLGIGRDGFGPKVQGWEVTRIVRKVDGNIAYLAQVKGGQVVEFARSVSSEDAIEFTNPLHDFPQRIRYSRQGQLLVAEISLLDGSRPQRWLYRPVAAPMLETPPTEPPPQSP